MTDSESRSIRLAFLPLTDAAPLIVAHERGFFAQFGLSSSLLRCTSWTAARDAVDHGAVHAAQMLFGMPVANALGRLGNHSQALVIPWILSRNGQAITLHQRHAERLKGDVRSLAQDVFERRDKGRPWALAMTLNSGTHAMWLRYWLGAGGINPDRDVALFTVPPPQMVGNLRSGNLDGFCVGEPWNARALSDGLGFTAITSQQIWPNHPEKVCAFTEEFVEKHPEVTKSVLKALYLAGEWLDAPGNREEAAQLLARPEYLNCPVDALLPRLTGRYECGAGRRMEADPHTVAFGPRGGGNYPQPKYVLWWLSQMRRWNMTHGAPEYAGVTNRILRPDLYEAAMTELGVHPGGVDLRPETLFDGCEFDPSAPERYALSFPVHSVVQN